MQEYQESGDLQAWQRAWRIGDEIARNGYRIRPSVIWQRFEELITRAARQAAVEPTSENVRTAVDLTELAGRLKLEVNLDRAQEALYDAMVDTIPDTSELRQLALLLNVSPAVVHAE